MLKKHSDIEGENNGNIVTEHNKFDKEIVQNSLTEAVQKLCDETNVFCRLVKVEFEPFIQNGFPEIFLNKLVERLNNDINVKSSDMFYSSYYKFIHNMSFTCININSKHLKVLLYETC